MAGTFTQPLWPDRLFCRTSLRNLLLVAATVAVGLGLYERGYTYEGAAIFFMLAGVILSFPYYHACYRGWMTYLVFVGLMPLSIWLQCRGVLAELWTYPPGHQYLAWITAPGEGWKGWTRHFWLGADMPAMEYVFYPLWSFFHMTVYALYSALLPDDHFERALPQLRYLFVPVMGIVTGLYYGCAFFYSRPGTTDYMQWMTGGIGFTVLWAVYVLSPSYRLYTQSKAFWFWVVGMGTVTALWEVFHSAYNRDWVYNAAVTPPWYVTIGDNGVPFTNLFGYLMTTTTFQAMMLFFVQRFGYIVVKDPKLIPFSRVGVS